MEQAPAALRKAIGQQLIEKALERSNSSSGKQPGGGGGGAFTTGTDGGGRAAGGGGGGGPFRRSRRGEPGADFKAFGEFLEANQTHVLLGLFVCTQAASLVLMKASLLSLAAPGVLTALHQAAAVAAVLVASSFGLLTDQPVITGQSVRGASVQAAIAGLQLLTLMATLRYGSVFMLLCWMAALPSALAAALEAVLGRRRPPPQMLALLGASLAGAVLEFLFDHHKSFAAVVMLLLWTAAKAAEFGWRLLRLDATAGGRISDHEFLYHCRSIADAEESQNAATLVLLQNLLPAGPCLVLGIVTLEGQELAAHEPSVPALTLLLLSCAAHAGSVALQALLRAQVAAEAWQLMTAAAWALAILLDYLERSHEMGLMPLLATALSVGSGLAASLAAWRRAAGAGGGLSSLALLTTQPLVFGGGGGGGGGGRSSTVSSGGAAVAAAAAAGKLQQLLREGSESDLRVQKEGGGAAGDEETGVYLTRRSGGSGSSGGGSGNQSFADFRRGGRMLRRRLWGH